MKVAVLSDIHGFSPALHDVLEHIRTQDVDQIIVAGDICAGGPDPAGSIQLVRRHGCAAVYGNTDRDLLDDGDSDGSDRWTRQQLAPTDMDWLRSLPFSAHVPHPDAGTEAGHRTLLVVHANPVDVDRHLPPEAPEHEILAIVCDEPARTIAFGHLHVAYSRQVGPYTLVDVSAVGNPRDNDLRPRYVVFTSEGDDQPWSHEFHYLDYPLERTRDLMERSGMPGWEQAWERLVKDR